MMPGVPAPLWVLQKPGGSARRVAEGWEKAAGPAVTAELASGSQLPGKHTPREQAPQI